MTGTASGDGQTAQVGTMLPNPLRVVVTLSGAPQPGKTVTWAAPGAGASVGSPAAVTDASGIATTTWTLGSTAGTQNATATLAGATGSPVTFAATAAALPVPVIQMTASASGNAQTGVVATALANPLRVLVTLSATPQAGDTVTWAAVGTGASVTPPKSVTDATGVATTAWTLGHTAGSQSATATLAGATGSPVTFSATGTPGAATQLTLVSGNSQSAVTSTAFTNPLVVKVADQFGNGIAGDTVAWLSLHGVTSVLPAKAASGAGGLAQASLTAGGTAGADTITATSAGLTGSPVRFSATVTSVPTTASVTVGPSIVFTSVKNNSSNPAVDTVAVNGTVTWTWAAGSIQHSVQSTGSPSFTSSAIQSSGTYSFTFTVAGTYTYDCAVHGTSMSGRVVVK
ncbi:MAG: hypothetical protein B7Z72_05470 [Gemmatimonadetes bacterium 21-71-4]|nr:MAG: hypothetical protein B7Z72_05470 [Gemmatimonadetes bacterium 21-71-4]